MMKKKSLSWATYLDTIRGLLARRDPPIVFSGNWSRRELEEVLLITHWFNKGIPPDEAVDGIYHDIIRNRVLAPETSFFDQVSVVEGAKTYVYISSLKIGEEE